MASYSRIQLEAWIKNIDVKGRVLDIGGCQKPLQGRTKSWNPTVYQIADLEQPHERNAIVDIILDIQEEELLEKDFAGTEYDQVFCLEVAEYWYDPLKALKNIYAVMKTGSKLYISFHFLYPIHNPEKADYLRYTREGARRLLKEAGFEIDQIIGKGYANPLMVKMLYDEEGMKGTGGNAGEIHREQGWLITATRL